MGGVLKSATRLAAITPRWKSQAPIPRASPQGYAEVDARRVHIVALDLPTSWSLATVDDKFTGRMLAAVNGMLLDMLAAIARKDYVDRRRRQAEGTTKAQAAGLYKGRPEDARRNTGIATMLRAGSSWQQIQSVFGCSRDTIARVRKRLSMAAAEATQA